MTTEDKAPPPFVFEEKCGCNGSIRADSLQAIEKWRREHICGERLRISQHTSPALRQDVIGCWPK